MDRPAPHEPSESCPLALPPCLQKRRSSETRLGDAGDWPGTRAEVPRSPPPPRGAFQIPDCRPPVADGAHYLRPARQPAPLPRAAPTRRCRHRRRDSTAFDVPLGVGRDRTERQTQQPNRHRFYLAPPNTIKRRPDWRMREGARPIRGPDGLEAFQASPSSESARLAGASACASDRTCSEERGLLSGSATVAVFVLLPTCGTSQESHGQAGGDRALGGTRSPQEAGRSGWREPAGGRASSWREWALSSSREGEGRGRAGARAKFEIVQNSGW